jgi:hypothetical protein
MGSCGGSDAGTAAALNSSCGLLNQNHMTSIKSSGWFCNDREIAAMLDSHL